MFERLKDWKGILYGSTILFAFGCLPSVALVILNVSIGVAVSRYFEFHWFFGVAGAFVIFGACVGMMELRRFVRCPECNRRIRGNLEERCRQCGGFRMRLFGPKD